MNNDFFKESDCDYSVDWQFTQGTEKARAISLSRANALLKERGRVVFGQPGEHWTNAGDQYHTHTAILINIQAIETDSIEKILREFIKQADAYAFDDSEWGN
jgi:hypothetical protein